MKISDALLGEHGLFQALFDGMDAAAAGATSADQIRVATSLLATAVQTHAQIEEDILFPALERAGLTCGPLTIMRAEHQEIDELLSAIAVANDLAGAQDGAARLLDLLRAHFRKEELLLFPLIAHALPDGELSELGQRWSGQRGVACG